LGLINLVPKGIFEQTSFLPDFTFLGLVCNSTAFLMLDFTFSPNQKGSNINSAQEKQEAR
jgi:hypothetical protein